MNIPTKDDKAKYVSGLLNCYAVADVLDKNPKALAKEIEDMLPTAVDFQYLGWWLSLEDNIRHPQIRMLPNTVQYFSLKLSLACWFAWLVATTDKRCERAYQSAHDLLKDLGMTLAEIKLLSKLVKTYDLGSLIRVVPDSENPLLNK